MTPIPRLRTLPEAVRRLTPAQLTTLLELRPDLASPPPLDLAELTQRASRASSVRAALQTLDAWQGLVVEALAALPDPVAVEGLRALLGAESEAVHRAVDDLRVRALVWGGDQELHLVRAVREAQPTHPGGLATASPRPLTPEQIQLALDGCSEDERAVLDRLQWSPTGTVRRADRPVDLATATTPIERLLARQLLRPLDGDTVILPREVAWVLRGARFSRTPVSPTAPEPLAEPLIERYARHHDQAAVGAAFAAVHDVELLIQALDERPHRLLRTGALSARDVATLARRLGTDQPHTVFIVELATAAGLAAIGAAHALLPTAQADAWSLQPPAERWSALLTGWLAAERWFGQSALPGAHALGPEAEADYAPVLRRTTVALALESGTGAVPDRNRLAERLAWRLPHLIQTHRLSATTVIEWTWREAAWLGLVALDAVTVLAATTGSADHAVPAELGERFPEPVERIVLQADLTAVAPGPLEATVARDLRLLADQESRGGGGVYRFSSASLRRAFDAGWTTDRVRAWLTDHATTAVPQPLDFLVADVQRRHGSVRIGVAAAYLRVDDVAQAAHLLAHPAAESLRLREIAPGVLIADADPGELVELLRDLGMPPVLEDAGGTTVVAPTVARAPASAPVRPEAARKAAEIAAELSAPRRRSRVPAQSA